MVTETTFTAEQREALLEYAAERGDRAASRLFGVAEPTLRSWRHRAERKVTDHRARDEDAAGGKETGDADSMIADDLADVGIPTEEFDGGRGEYVNAPARARVLERFTIGDQYVSRGELRELRAPGTAGLSVGEIVLLGGRRFAEFGDLLWCVAERQDGKVMVRPARIRRDEKLNDQRNRIVSKGPEDKPPGYVTPEQRMQWHNEQIDRAGPPDARDSGASDAPAREILTRP